MSTTPRSESPAGSQGSHAANRAEQSMVVEHSTHDATGDDDETGPADMPAQQFQRQRQTEANVTGVPPDTPGSSLTDYDWLGFEQRYLEALREADEREQQVMEEFNQLVEYFAAWAAASSAHDDERAIKRLQTRSRHVQLSEGTLQQKKKHLTEVVKAFQSALALLSLS